MNDFPCVSTTLENKDKPLILDCHLRVQKLGKDLKPQKMCFFRISASKYDAVKK